MPNLKVVPKKIVTIGGGTGQFTLLRALVGIDDIEIVSVVSMADSGGSTGVLRDQYGVLPAGDVLKCLLALSPYKDARNLLQTRLKGHPSFQGHNAGNLLLTFLTRHANGDFPAAIEAMSEILNVQGIVLPVTTDKTTLVAKLSTGEHLFGEAAIDTPRGDRSGHIEDVYIVPHHGKLEVHPAVVDAIESADVIIIGPGDLFTSIVPNLLIPEVPQAIQKNIRAALIYVANLMTKHGETHGFKIENFVKVVEEHVGRPLARVIVNTKQMSDEVKANYDAQSAFLVNSPEDLGDKFVGAELLAEEGKVARHNSEALQSLIETLI